MAGRLPLWLILTALAMAIGIVVLLMIAWPITETCEEHARRVGYGRISRECLIVEDRLFRWDVRLWHLPELHALLIAAAVAIASWAALMLVTRLRHDR